VSGTIGTDSVYDELFGLHHRALRYLDVWHALPQETAHPPAFFTYEVRMVSRATFWGGSMGAVPPHPIRSLYRVYDCPALQGKKGSVNRYPVERSYFFSSPEIGVGNRTAEFQ
jgi:hypothetical protein